MKSWNVHSGALEPYGICILHSNDEWYRAAEKSTNNRNRRLTVVCWGPNPGDLMLPKGYLYQLSAAFCRARLYNFSIFRGFSYCSQMIFHTVSRFKSSFKVQPTRNFPIMLCSVMKQMFNVKCCSLRRRWTCGEQTQQPVGGCVDNPHVQHKLQCIPLSLSLRTCGT